MTNQTRSAVHDAATKAETLAYNLASASSLASVLSEVLDKEIGSTIEGQSFAAPITLLDKLKEDDKGLERRTVRPHRDMHGRAANKAPSAGAGTYGGGRGYGPDPSNGGVQEGRRSLRGRFRGKAAVLRQRPRIHHGVR